MEFLYPIRYYFDTLAVYIQNYTFAEFWSDHLSYWIPAILANLTVTGSLVILAVLLLRFFYRKFRIERYLPYWPVYALWAVVLFRLLCPITVPTPVSLFGLLDTPLSETGSLAYIPTRLVHETYPTVTLPVPDAVNETLTNALPSGHYQDTADPMEGELVLLSILWHLGAYGLLVAGILTGLVQVIRLRWRLREALPDGYTGNHLRVPVYLADRIDSPFVLGLFRPKIYLPSAAPDGNPLTETEKKYILLHELHHIRRGDILWKTVGFLCVCVHWFNPLVWLGFRMAEKDMEITCDQWVVRRLAKDDPDAPLAYSGTLLKLASPVRSRGFLPVAPPVAFGESAAGERIRRLVGYRKPLVWGIAAAVVLAVLSVVLLATNPVSAPVTVLAGADYKVAQVVYSRKKEPIPEDAPWFRITPDRHLCIWVKMEELYVEYASLAMTPCNGTYEWGGDGYITHEAVTKEMLLACRRWSDAYDRTGSIRPVTDAWGVQTEEDWYLAFQTRGGKTYLANGTTDENGEGTLHWILRLESTFDRQKDVSRTAGYTEALLQIGKDHGLGAVHFFADYTDARIPDEFLLGFRLYPADGTKHPQMLGYAHFSVYDTGVVFASAHAADAAPEGYALAPSVLYGGSHRKVVLTYQCDEIAAMHVTREDGTKERYSMEYSRTGIELIPMRNENWSDIERIEVEFADGSVQTSE